MTAQKAREPPTNEKSLGGAAGLLLFIPPWRISEGTILENNDKACQSFIQGDTWKVCCQSMPNIRPAKFLFFRSLEGI